VNCALIFYTADTAGREEEALDRRKEEENDIATETTDRIVSRSHVKGFADTGGLLRPL